MWGHIGNNENEKKTGGGKGPLKLHRSFFKKFLQELFSYWLLLLACLVQADILLVAWNGSLLFLEMICETDSFVFFLPTERTGLLTPLLTCFTLLLLSLLLGPNTLSPTSFLLFTLLDKIMLSQNFPLFFTLPRQKIRSLTPNIQKYWESHFPADFEKFPLFAYLFHTLATGV